MELRRPPHPRRSAFGPLGWTTAFFAVLLAATVVFRNVRAVVLAIGILGALYAWRRRDEPRVRMAAALALAAVVGFGAWTSWRAWERSHPLDRPGFLEPAPSR